MEWYFKTEDLMGEATGEAYRNTLQASGMPPAGVLAREAIQNSVDAAAKDALGKVRVEFRRRLLVGDEKRSLADALDLAESIADRRQVLEFQRNNSIERIRDSEYPLEILYVEDFGTHGLYGSPQDSDSHFRKLLLTLGRSDKERGPKSTGGSYGYGKAVYPASSHIYTIVAHTVFDPGLMPEKEPVYERLMGCGYFNAHTLDGQEFTGRAWFGVADRDRDGLIHPLENEQAHAFARTLGFTERSPEETGTSILIIDSSFDLDDLVWSVEKWWWPRLIDNNLEVVVHDGARREIPRPMKRGRLKPYINAYNLALSRTAPSGQHEKAGSFNKSEGINYGSYGLTIVDEDLESAEEADEELVSTVALMRGPRMVVDYARFGSPQLQFAGAIVADDDIDEALRLSEPLSHRGWDVNSERFRSEKQKKQVDSLLGRVRRLVRDFIREATPQSPENGTRLIALERLFGGFFKIGARKPGGPTPAKSDPIQIHFKEQPDFIVVGPDRKTAGSFHVQLAPDAYQAEVISEIGVICQPIEEDGIGTKDPIGTHLKSSSGSEGRGSVLIELLPDQTELVQFETDLYPGDWTVQVSVNIEGVQ